MAILTVKEGFLRAVEVHRSHFRERPDAEAYAAKHGGVLVQMWPRLEDAAAVGNFLPT